MQIYFVFCFKSFCHRFTPLLKVYKAKSKKNVEKKHPIDV